MKTNERNIEQFKEKNKERVKVNERKGNRTRQGAKERKKNCYLVRITRNKYC